MINHWYIERANESNFPSRFLFQNPAAYLGLLLGLLLLVCMPCRASELRLGIIGTDSTHATEFTRILNDVQAKDHISGARVVAAYCGGSPSLDLSRNRIDSITTQLRQKWKISFVPQIRDLCPLVDGLLILSVDPRLRQQEFAEAATCSKPVFVDSRLLPA